MGRLKLVVGKNERHILEANVSAWTRKMEVFVDGYLTWSKVVPSGRHVITDVGQNEKHRVQLYIEGWSNIVPLIDGVRAQGMCLECEQWLTAASNLVTSLDTEGKGFESWIPKLPANSSLHSNAAKILQDFHAKINGEEIKQLFDLCTECPQSSAPGEAQVIRSLRSQHKSLCEAWLNVLRQNIAHFQTYFSSQLRPLGMVPAPGYQSAPVLNQQEALYMQMMAQIQQQTILLQIQMNAQNQNLWRNMANGIRLQNAEWDAVRNDELVMRLLPAWP